MTLDERVKSWLEDDSDCHYSKSGCSGTAALMRALVAEIELLRAKHQGIMNLAMMPGMKTMLTLKHDLEQSEIVRDRYGFALTRIANCHPNVGALIQCGNIAREALEVQP